MSTTGAQDSHQRYKIDAIGRYLKVEIEKAVKRQRYQAAESANG
jgi:hypothetical protein